MNAPVTIITEFEDATDASVTYDFDDPRLLRADELSDHMQQKQFIRHADAEQMCKRIMMRLMRRYGDGQSPAVFMVCAHCTHTRPHCRCDRQGVSGGDGSWRYLNHGHRYRCWAVDIRGLIGLNVLAQFDGEERTALTKFIADWLVVNK